MLNKTLYFCTLPLLNSFLIGCGGGSDDSVTPPKTSITTLPANKETAESTGQITEKLDLNTKYQIIYNFPLGMSGSKYGIVQQNNDGLITEFGSFKLSGTLAGKEIQGNKNFLVARLARGVISYTDQNMTTSELIEKYSNGSYYYFAFKPITHKIESKNSKKINCTNYNITQARVTNAEGSLFIQPSLTDGSIELNSDGTINTQFTVRYGSESTTYTGSANWNNHYSSYKLLGIQGQQGNSSQIGNFDFGDNGTNSIVVGALYKLSLNAGGRYLGALTMSCSI